MYIKIKHIKQLLLVSACMFLAGFNYFTYVKADNSSIFEATSCDKTLDEDCDGLTNTEEALYETDPKNTDSDGDGYSDAIEVKSGYDPLKPSPGDKIILATDSTSDTTSSYQEESSMTDDFVQKIKTLTDSKGENKITTTEIQDLATADMDEKVGPPITWQTLPEINVGQLRILPQDYSSLTDEEKKIRLQKDTSVYITKIAYLLASNAPGSISTDNDVRVLGEEFASHLYSFSTSSPDLEYFTDIEKRFGLFSDQAMDVEVPETMMDLHIKIIRFSKGFSMLSEEQKSTNDPLENFVALSKILNFLDLLIDFSENDLQNYISQIK